MIFGRIEEQLRNPAVMSIERGEPVTRISRWFDVVDSSYFETYRDWGILDFKDTNFVAREIKSLVFNGFKKSVNTYAKFDSDSERKFAVVSEKDPTILKRMKPKLWLFKISFYINNRHQYYNPDFVVETDEYKYLVEIKSSDEINDTEVLEKARSAKLWCEAVNQKLDEWVIEWKKRKYVIMQHDRITIDKTFGFLLSVHAG